MNIVDAAWQVIAMDKELRYLRSENARLLEIEKAYDQLLKDSIEHSEKMSFGMLAIALNRPEILEAQP